MNFNRMVTWLEETIIVVCYIALISIVGIETVRRFVTKEQAAWGPEVAIYAFIWMSWFAVSKNIAEDRHLAFTAIRERLPRPVQKILAQADCLLWLALSAIIIWGSIGLVGMNIRFQQIIFGTDIPLAVATAAVPIAWAFCLVRVVQRLVAITTGRGLGGHPWAVEDLR